MGRESGPALTVQSKAKMREVVLKVSLVATVEQVVSGRARVWRWGRAAACEKLCFFGRNFWAQDFFYSRTNCGRVNFLDEERASSTDKGRDGLCRRARPDYIKGKVVSASKGRAGEEGQRRV